MGSNPPNFNLVFQSPFGPRAHAHGHNMLGAQEIAVCSSQSFPVMHARSAIHCNISPSFYQTVDFTMEGKDHDYLQQHADFSWEVRLVARNIGLCPLKLLQQSIPREA